MTAGQSKHIDHMLGNQAAQATTPEAEWSRGGRHRHAEGLVVRPAARHTPPKGPHTDDKEYVNIGACQDSLRFIMFTMFHHVHYVSLCFTPAKHRDCLVVVPCQTRSARLT